MLPARKELTYLGVIILACGGLYMAGRRINELEARPLVFDASVDARTEDVRRGPVTIKRHSVTAPDGTKTVDSERTEGPVESHVESSSEKTHRETPPARARTRYVGLGIDPLAYARMPRLRAGVTLWSALDVGVAYDARLPMTGGAFQFEAAYRF